MWVDTYVNSCKVSFKANTKAVEQTVTAEMNLGNKSQTKQNPFLLLAVERCIDPPPKSIETPSVCFLSVDGGKKAGEWSLPLS